MIACDLCGKMKESDDGWRLIAVYDLPIPWLDAPSPLRRVICPGCWLALRDRLDAVEKE